ncbi:MAG: hypothetical protein US98_C0032G0003 [Parcubacteria group bacterium GW2011_GWC1_38_6]|nr:MAG: hypothetical protein US98_C0032G0003 [Parcubacteria group bacterium GW2011_GWC1_38_6]
MIFVEFVVSSGSIPKKSYFIGATIQDVLNDTKDGKEFGGAKLSSYREISFEDAYLLKFDYFDHGVASVRGGCKSYWLGERNTV